MTEPFADAEKLRAELRHLRDRAGHAPAARAAAASSRRTRVPTLVLYGPEDHVIPRDFPERCEVAFTELRRARSSCRGAGHFLQWERADLLNQSLIYFFARPARRRMSVELERQHGAAHRRDRRHRPRDRARPARPRRDRGR